MSILRSTLLLTLTNLAVRTGSYAFRIIMARMLTLYEFGILNLALPLQFFIVILSSAGIAPSIAKFVAEGKEKAVSSALFYFTLIALGFSVLTALLSPVIAVNIFHDRNVAIPLAIASLALPFAAAIAVLTGAMQGKKKMASFASSLLILQGGRIVFATILVLFFATAGYAVAGSVMGFAFALITAFWLFRGTEIKITKPDFSSFKEVFNFSLPVSITSIAAFALAYLDILMLGAFLSPKEVGIYSVASPTSRLVLAFSSAIYATILPRISGLRGDKTKIRKVVAYSTRISFVVLFITTVIFIIISKPIILLLFGSRYSQAVNPFRILLFGTFFFGMYTLNSGVFQGMGMPKIPMKILVVSAVLDLILNLALIPNYGIIGAAIASSTSMILAGLSSVLLLHRYMKD